MGIVIVEKEVRKVGGAGRKGIKFLGGRRAVITLDCCQKKRMVGGKKKVFPFFSVSVDRHFSTVRRSILKSFYTM